MKDKYIDCPKCGGSGETLWMGGNCSRCCSSGIVKKRKTRSDKGKKRVSKGALNVRTIYK